MTKITNALYQSGLNQKEATVYEAVMELDSASVQNIAKKAQIVRSTAYEILESLRAKGLITTFLKKRVRFYSAEEPDRLLSWVENRADEIKKIMPELQILGGQSRKRPTVRFYEGREGIANVLQEILNDADKLICSASVDDVFKKIDHFEKFVENRIKRKIPLRVILRESILAYERKKLGPQQLRQVKIASASFVFHGMIYIWKNKIAMIAFTNDYIAVVTESQELVDMQTALFENLWEKLDG